MSDALHLMAANQEDASVISAMVQDAAIRVGDLAYIEEERRFAAVFNRFRWETQSKRGLFRRGQAERVRAGLSIGDVRQIRLKSLDLKQRDEVLALLAITVEPLSEDEEDPATRIQLIFSGGAAIAIDADCINLDLRDLGEPWPAKARPRHALH
ncbi:MAG: DUF2948 family protein [Pseudomonadota bacterium]